MAESLRERILGDSAQCREYSAMVKRIAGLQIMWGLHKDNGDCLITVIARDGTRLTLPVTNDWIKANSPKNFGYVPEMKVALEKHVNNCDSEGCRIAKIWMHAANAYGSPCNERRKLPGGEKLRALISEAGGPLRHVTISVESGHEELVDELEPLFRRLLNKKGQEFFNWPSLKKQAKRKR
jgi:hypothetical protein